MAKISGAFPVRWKPQDGAPGEGVTISQHITRYAVGTSGTVQPTSGWSTSIPKAENGKYLWTWVYMKYSDGTETNAYSVSRMGIDGKGIKSSVVTYSQQETNVSPEDITNWGTFPETLHDGHWLYTRTVITYSEGTDTTTSYSVSQVGVGSYYAGTEEYYALSASRTVVPEGHPAGGDAAIFGKDADINITGDWSQERPAADNDTPYIWNFSISHDSRDNSYVTKAICIGNFAKGIVSIVESYAISAQGTAPSGKKYPSDIADNDWTDEVHAAAPTEAKPYQWNRTVTTYNDNSTETHYHVSAVKGADGKGSVYIDLDNENDTMLYDGYGKLLSGSATSNIVLYENGTKAPSQPTFSIKDKSTSVAASISGSVLTVSGCTDSGYVIVKCTYKNTEYTARFTVKRLVGVDKYEISLDHNAVIHNTDTDALSVAVITATVYRTGQNGTREMVAALTTYGLTMEYWPNGLSANKKSITDYSSGASITIDSDWESVDVVLKKDGVVVDRESVPIGKVKNGPKGEGAMRLDLDNENDTMLYDGTNTTCLSGNVTSQATLYQGTRKIESGITWSYNTTNCKATISTSGKVTVTAMSSSSGSVTVNAQYGGETYTALLTLKKIRGNDKYELVCSPNAITYNKDNGTVSASVISVQVFKTDAAGVRENISTLPNGFTLDVTNGTISRAYSGKYANITLNNGYNYNDIAIKLYQGTLLLDSETIPVCKVGNGVGEPGANAKSIYKNSFEKPDTPTGTSPSGWSNDMIEQAPVNVEYQGEWVKDADGWRVAPQIGNSQESNAAIQFITTEENQVVYLRVKASIPTMDDVFVGKVDDATPRKDGSHRYFRLFGTGQDTGDYPITVPTAGVHFLIISYVRLSDTTSTMAHYVKYKFGVMPTWKSDAKEFNTDQTVKTWTTPYRVSIVEDEDLHHTKPNLLMQTSFISTQMDKWVIQGGATASGIHGNSSYMGQNSSTENYKELLKQIVYDNETTAIADCPILPNTWYTLSFWAKTSSSSTTEKLATYLYPSCASAEQATHTFIDTTAAKYVDGAKQTITNSTDNGVSWVLTTAWKRYWMSFKTRSSLPSTAKQQLLFRLLKGSNIVYVCMPKLEQGIGPTDYCVNDRDIVDRSANENGFPNDRGVWVEAPTEEYAWNDAHRDYVSFNIDGEFKKFFVKRKGMTVPNGMAPAKGGTQYWEEGNAVSTLLANTIIGNNVELGGFLVSNYMLKSKNGTLELDGINGLIKLFHADGYSWQVLENGMQVLGAYPEGQHIQLDPEAKEVRVYNESGACVTRISGDTMASLDNIFGSSQGSLTINSNKSGTKTLTQTVTDRNDVNFSTDLSKSEELSIGEFSTSSDTRITVNLTAKVSAHTTTTVPDESILSSNGGINTPIVQPSYNLGTDGLLHITNKAEIKVFVKTYEDKSCTVLKKTLSLYYIASIGKGEKSESNISVHGELTSGYHKVFVKYILQTPGCQTTSYVSLRTATANWAISSVSYVSDMYISRLFANGMAYGTSANNFFAAMNDENGKMLIKGVTLNANGEANGFELSQQGLSILHKGVSFRPMVTLGMGILQYTSGKLSWMRFQSGLRGSATPTVARTNAGYYVITFPTNWTNIISNVNCLFVTVSAYHAASTTTKRPLVTSVPLLSNAQCQIVVSQGSTAIDECVLVKIEYMLP